MTRDDFAAQRGFAPGSVLLKRALTHRSAAEGLDGSNERLEFLGDALLGAFVAHYLYDALPQETEEGVLSRARVQVIRMETLADAARTLGIADMLDVGPGERKERRQTHDSLLADAFEAITAAVYLEQGRDALEAFLKDVLRDALAAVVSEPPEPDAKTSLQMRLQSLGRGLPTYRTVEASGIGHDHHFVVEVVDASGTTLGRGEGPNKRSAQSEAAREALADIADDKP